MGTYIAAMACARSYAISACETAIVWTHALGTGLVSSKREGFLFLGGTCVAAISVCNMRGYQRVRDRDSVDSRISCAGLVSSRRARLEANFCRAAAIWG